MLRGGSFINNGNNCRSAYRNNNAPDNRNNNVGFRLAVSASTLYVRAGEWEFTGRALESPERIPAMRATASENKAGRVRLVAHQGERRRGPLILRHKRQAIKAALIQCGLVS